MKIMIFNAWAGSKSEVTMLSGMLQNPYILFFRPLGPFHLGGIKDPKVPDDVIFRKSRDKSIAGIDGNSEIG